MEPELNQLGLDFLKFLAAFVVITPVFKKINVSPILGFLLAGVLLRQAEYDPFSLCACDCVHKMYIPQAKVCLIASAHAPTYNFIR